MLLELNRITCYRSGLEGQTLSTVGPEKGVKFELLQQCRLCPAAQRRKVTFYRDKRDGLRFILETEEDSRSACAAADVKVTCKIQIKRPHKSKQF